MRAAGGGTSPAGRRARISIQMEISALLAKRGGGISKGFCLYLWFYLFILKDLVRPDPLTPARELFLC